MSPADTCYSCSDGTDHSSHFPDGCGFDFSEVQEVPLGVAWKYITYCEKFLIISGFRRGKGFVAFVNSPRLKFVISCSLG